MAKGTALMANNRVSLVCSECHMTMFLGKYYPDSWGIGLWSGPLNKWFIGTPTDLDVAVKGMQAESVIGTHQFVDDLNIFLATHRHAVKSINGGTSGGVFPYTLLVEDEWPDD